jgi:hypothetical protein
MPDPGIIMLWLLVVAGVALYTRWWLRRIREMVGRWAARSGLRVLDYRVLWLPSSRRSAVLMLRSSRNQVVVSLRVYDPQLHRIRAGWLRLGGFWFGLIDADAAEVFWAETPA